MGYRHALGSAWRIYTSCIATHNFRSTQVAKAEGLLKDARAGRSHPNDAGVGAPLARVLYRERLTLMCSVKQAESSVLA